LELPARQRRRGVSGRSGVRAAGVGLLPPSTGEPGEAVAPADDLGELVEELVDPFVTGGRQCGEGLRQIRAVVVAGRQDGWWVRYPRYVNALTARATTSPKSASATVDCTSMAYFARRVSGITSVGLNAVALVKPRCR